MKKSDNLSKEKKFNQFLNQKNVDRINIVSISSLFQFYIFLSCIYEEKVESNLIIINNIQIKDETVDQIFKRCNQEGFFFFDLRFFLKKNINRLISNKSLKLYNQIFSNLLENVSVDKIYLRYKINLPESLIINCFNKSKLNFFEDGLSDYIITKNLSGFKKKARFSINTKNYLINFFSLFLPNNRILKYHYKKPMFKRANTLYEFINFNEGDSKITLLNYAKKIIDISDNFKNIIELDSKDYLELIKSKSILFLGGPFLHSYKKGKIAVLNEIKLYIKFFDILVSKFPDSTFYFKPHPSTPDSVLDLLNNELKMYFFFLPKDILSEVIIANKKIWGVGAFLSSSLFYTKILYPHKFVFYLYLENSGIIEYDANLKTVVPIFNKFQISKIDMK